MERLLPLLATEFPLAYYHNAMYGMRVTYIIFGIMHIAILCSLGFTFEEVCQLLQAIILSHCRLFTNNVQCPQDIVCTLGRYDDGSADVPLLILPVLHTPRPRECACQGGGISGLRDG